MSNFTPKQTSAITFLTIGVFNDDRHNDILESLGSNQDDLALLLQPYGAVAADKSESYPDDVIAHDFCEGIASQLFINLFLDSGLPDLNEWKEHMEGMMNELANYRAMIP
jgi:hypothetical protein